MIALRHLDMAVLEIIRDRHYSGDKKHIPYVTASAAEYEKEHDSLYRKYMTEIGHANLLDKIERYFRYGKGIL